MGKGGEAVCPKCKGPKEWFEIWCIPCHKELYPGAHE
jgi:hypothetical protein